MPDHGKAGGIARDVLDVFGEHVEPVVNTSLAAGDGGCILPAGGHFGGHAGTGHLDEPRGGEVTGQPVAALGERLRAAVDLLDRRAVARCEQRVMNPQRHLGADLDRQPREVVERVGDSAIGGVLERHDAEVGVTGLHLFEGGRDAGHRHEVDGTAEPVEGREVAVGPGRAEMGHADVLLDRPGARDQFPKHGLHALVRQRAVVGRRHPLEHRLLAGRIVGLLAGGLLDVANLAGDLRAIVHQADELPIELVDLRPEMGEARLPGPVRCRIPRCARVCHCCPGAVRQREAAKMAASPEPAVGRANDAHHCTHG